MQAHSFSFIDPLFPLFIVLWTLLSFLRLWNSKHPSYPLSSLHLFDHVLRLITRIIHLTNLLTKGLSTIDCTVWVVGIEMVPLHDLRQHTVMVLIVLIHSCSNGVVDVVSREVEVRGLLQGFHFVKLVDDHRDIDHLSLH